MAYVEFDGSLDGESSSGFVPFAGELDKPKGVIGRIKDALTRPGEQIAESGAVDPMTGIDPTGGQAIEAPSSTGSVMDSLPAGAAPAEFDASKVGFAKAGANRMQRDADTARLQAVGDQVMQQGEATAIKPSIYTPANIAGNFADNARNVGAGVLKISPTAVKGVADIGRLATGDTVGRDTSEYMKRGMDAIDQIIGSDQFNQAQTGFKSVMSDPNQTVGDMFSYLIDHPNILLDNGITTIGSMALPAGVAGAAVKLGAKGVGATAAAIGTGSAQNAADTFSELDKQSMPDRYKGAAVSAAVSILMGIATGGGAEGEIARKMAGNLTSGKIGLEPVKAYLKATFKEAAQEGGEELGNAAGEAVGSGVAPDPINLAKRTAFAATLGGIMGGGTHAVIGGESGPGPAEIAAENARRAALTKAETMFAPLQQAKARATVADIQSATTVDDAIAAAAAVVNTPISAPVSQTSDQQQAIAALEAQAGLTAETDVSQQTIPAPADDYAPNAMQLAMQQAQRKLLLTPVSQRAEQAATPQEPSNAPTYRALHESIPLDPVAPAAPIQPDTASGRAPDAQLAQGGTPDTAPSGPVAGRDPAASGGTGQPQPALTPVVSFKTAKGSTYKVEGNATIRDKAARLEHPGESGIQPKSDVTVYVSKADADRLGEVQSKGSGRKEIAALGDGRYGMRYLDGKDAGKFEQRTVITPKTEPAVGLIPVEITAGYTPHFGNEITEVSTNKSEDIAGDKINKEWTAFDQASGTLGIPRSEMPQIKAEHRGALVNFLNARGISHEQGEVDPSTLKPTQLEFSQSKVNKAKGFTGTDRSILVSADGHVLDGHHQWLSKREAGEPVKAIRLNAPIRKLLADVAEFPSVQAASGAKPAQAAEQQSTDRRQDVTTRKTVNAMTPDELRQALLVSDKTGLGNERAYHEAPKKAIVASIDLDSLGWINDNMGHAAGDRFLALAGQAMKEVTGDIYHTSGDEFKAHFDSEAIGHDILGKIRARLKGAVLEFTKPDGTVVTKKGIGFSYGLDKTFGAADAKLYADKAAREASGDRARKGTEPAGVSRQPAAGNQADQSVPAPAKVTTKAEREQRHLDTIKEYEELSSKKLRAIAGSRKFPAYRRNAAADILQTRDQANRAKRSDTMKKLYAKTKGIDPDRDTMAQAVAKLGGIDRESAEGRLRLAPEELNRRGHGVLFMFHAKGKSMDEIGQQLAELGYVEKDEHGKHDQTDFEDKLAESAGGIDVFTPNAIMLRAEADRAQAMEEVGVPSPEAYDTVEHFTDDAQDDIQAGIDAAFDSLGEQEVLSDEEIDALFGGHATGRSIPEIDSAGMADESGQGNQAPRENPERNAQQVDPGRDDFGLQGQTESEARAQTAAAEQQRTDAAAEERRAAEAERQAGIKKEIDSRQDASADNFQLGQSAEESLAGQGSIFDQPTREEAADLIAQSDMPTAEQIKINALLRKGDVTPADVMAVLQPSEKPAANIGDFGEKIAGAKKELWQDYKNRMAEELPDDAADITLAKHFPEPNYEALINEGVDVTVLAAIKAMRDEIPSKPRRAYKLSGWADNLRALRTLSNSLITGENDIFKVMDLMRSPAFRLTKFADRIQMYADLGYPTFKRAADYKIDSGAYSYFESKEYKPPITKFEIVKSGRTVAYFDGYLDALEALRARLTAETESPGAQRETKLDIYRLSGGDIIIGKKIAAGKFIDLKGGFTTARDARAYHEQHKAELLALLEKKKEVRPERRSVNDPRIGIDRRLGEDIAPATFAETFGFRGVQFGNYVEQSRRAKDLNNAYDALLDLADTINVPARALSLNGELGLAFGARGSGGKNAFAAHYEAGHVVINLTKSSGAGSLGHEWFHALDNYFSRLRGDSAGFVTNSPRPKRVYGPDRTFIPDASIRPEVLDAFNGIVTAIKSSGMLKRSQQLDARRTKDYWSTSLEMAARAFESYVIDKAREQGRSNDYLANILGEDAHNAMNDMMGDNEPFAYPTRDEAPVINAAFDKLFATLQTRETDKGVALFFRPGTNPVDFAVKSGIIPKVTFRGTEPFKSKSHANLYRLKNHLTDTTAVEVAGGWSLAPKAGPLTAAEQKEARTDVAALNRVLKDNGQPEVLPLLDVPSANHELARRLGKIFGTRIQFVSNNDAFDGVAVNGIAYLTKDLKQPELAIAGHEVFHTLEQTNPAMAEDLLDHVRGYLREGVIAERQQRETRLSGQETTERYAAGEIMADINGAMWLDPQFWREMLDRDTNLFRRVAYLFMENVAKAVESLTGTRFDVAALVTDVNAVRKLIAQTWADRNQQGDTRQADENGLAFSRAYHGTPHRFEQFSTAAIGSGEGNQAFGWGLYFSGRKGVAEYYRNALSTTTPAHNTIDGKRINKKMLADLQNDPDRHVKNFFNSKAGVRAAGITNIAKAVDDAIETAEENRDNYQQRLDSHLANPPVASTYGAPDYARFIAAYGPQIEALKALKARLGFAKEQKNGQLVEAEIPDEHEYMAWDKPLHDQPAQVKAALSGVLTEWRTDKMDLLAGVFGEEAAKRETAISEKELTGESIYNWIATHPTADRAAGDRSASLYLNSLGIAGIKYLDGSSRGNGDGSSNYVVFDDSRVNIEALHYSLKDDAITVDGIERPTRNSDGKPIAYTKPILENFWRWFGDSKVVDDQGHPLLVYHGTKAQFDTFKPSKDGSNGPGIYLTPHKSLAEAHGKAMALYAKIESDADGQIAGYEVIVKDPRNVKSANLNAGTFDPSNPDIRFSRKEPAFYSALARTVPDMGKIADKNGNVGAEQARLWLMARQKEGRFKADELAWSGLDDYLKLQAGKVAVADIEAFVRDNGVQVQEVMKVPSDTSMLKPFTVEQATDGWNVLDHNQPNFRDGRIADGPFAEEWEANQRAEMLNDDLETGEYIGWNGNRVVPDAKYQKYQLPGGENYRELLLTLPQKEVAPDPAEVARVIAGRKQVFDQYEPFLNEHIKAADKALEKDDNTSHRFHWKQFISLRDERDAAARNLHGEVPHTRIEPAKFQSSHFDEANVLAHIRFNDRTDADGRKVLFIEELQSDWGQKGKKLGFATLSDKDVYAKLVEPNVPEGKNPDNYQGYWEIYKKSDDSHVARIDETGEFTESEAIDKAVKSANSRATPLAPFVTKTDAWLSLGIKRMIRYAAENGYDKIAFVNGQQSADRYDLSKQLETVRYVKDSKEDAKGRLLVVRKGSSNEEVLHSDVSDTTLPDFVGKETANKLLQQPLEYRRNLGIYSHDLNGLDLKVGGEGMKAFYDNIVPQVANDVLKKVGGGRVEMLKNITKNGDMAAIPKGKKWLVTDAQDERIVHGEFADEAAAMSFMRGARQLQPGFDITPAMRQTVMQGQPLFSRKERTEAENALKALSETDALFKLPKSTEKEVEDIAHENIPGVEIRKFSTIPGETRFNFTFANGRTARMMVRYSNPYGDTIYGFDMVDGDMTAQVNERPGRNAQAVDGKDDVYIDVSLLKEGSGYGGRMYNIAATYAYNNGKIFIGDPAGLSDEALVRRSEQMLSSALKFGTTRHLGPHPRQVKGDKDLGIPGLDWVYGDHIGNIEKLINVNLANIENAGGIGGITYNIANGTFTDIDGNELTRDDLSGLAESGLGRQAHAGGATIGRAALLGALRDAIAADRRHDAGTDRTGRVADARTDAQTGAGRQPGPQDAGLPAGEGGAGRDAIPSAGRGAVPESRANGVGILERLVLVASQFPATVDKLFYSRKEDDRTGDLFAVPDDQRTSVVKRALSNGPDAGPAKTAILRARSVPGEYATVVENRPGKTEQVGLTHVTSPADAAHATASLTDLAREHLDVLVLGKSGKILALQRMFAGGKTQSAVHPGEMIAFVNSIPGAESYYASHNHPSGIPDLSPADLRLTSEIRRMSEGITPKFEGLLALSHDQYTFTDDGSITDGRGPIPVLPKTETVQYVEQVFVKRDKLGDKVSSPIVARRIIDGVAKGRSGIVFADAQHYPVAFFPVDFATAEKLKGTPLARDVMAAAAKSNATSAFLATGDYSGNDGIENVGTLLSRADVRVMDAFGNHELKNPSAASYSEKGRNLKRSDDVLFSRKEQAQTVWDSPEPSKMGDDFIHTIQDKHIDTKRVVQAIRKTVGEINDHWNPYLQEELFHGRSAKQVSDFLGSELRPLLQDMQARGIPMPDFEEYLHMRHAEERNNQIAKINLEMPDGGSGVDTAEAREYLAGLPANKRRAYESLAKRVDTINKATRQILIDSGLEKPETIKAWESAYQYYVPLQRDEGGTGIGQGFSVRGSASKRAMGSKRAVVNILANLAMQRERTIVRAEKNRVSTALYGLAITAPNPDFWKPVNPGADVDRKLESLFEQRKAAAARRDTATSQYKIDQAKEAIDRIDGEIAAAKGKQKAAIDDLIRLGLNPLDAAKTFSEPTEQYIDPRTGLVAERINPFLRSAPNVISTRVNGEDRYVFFSEHDERAMRMVSSLKNLDADQLGMVLSMMAKVTRYFASINTQYNPIFGIVNLLRDAQESMFNLSTTPIAGKQKQVLAYTVSALRGIYIDLRDHRAGKPTNSTWAAEFEEFQKEGGQTGYRNLFSNSQERADALRKELKAISEGKLKAAGRAMFDWLSDYNETMENAVRLAAYKVAKEQGLSKQQSASIAKNISVNFNRKGSVSTQAGAMYAFFNAAVQGTARMAETLRGPKGKIFIGAGLALGSMQALILAAAGFDDDEPPEFIKSRNLIIPIGDGKYLSWPLPLGLKILPTIGRLMTEFVLDGFKDPSKKLVMLLDAIVDTFNPVGNAGMSIQTIAPTPLDPFVALSENRDWTGRKIAREDRSGLAPTPGYTRAKDTASEVSKALSYWINIASGGTKYKPGMISPTPDQLDYLIGQAAGGVGREASKLEQTVFATVTGEDLPPHKIPLAGRFYGDTKGNSSVAAKFYDNVRTLNEHEAELKGRRKDRGDVGGYLKDHPESLLFADANRIERDVSQLYKRKRELLEKDGGKERIKLVEMQIAAKMKQLNDRVAKQQQQAGK